ncbi:MAG: lipoate--protein ligase family protein [Chloroflexi bacterium]|nr:lipoate--protein ligase family protein [Chloroflexota bacterium]
MTAPRTSPAPSGRSVDSGPAGGARHMAIDEAVLESVAGGAAPVLRVFQFERPCLSLGRFQDARRGLDPERCASAGVEVVRRPTGGRAVLHAGDLCYAVAAPLADAAVGGSPGRAGVRDSYCRIAAVLARALALVGLPEADVAAGSGWSPDPSPGCFTFSGPFEIAGDGAKLVGSAQLRRSGALLQQGSIRLAADEALECRILGRSTPSLRDVLGREVACSEMADALRRAFRATLALPLEDAAPTPTEAALAERLEREKYASPEWTWAR